MKCFMGLTSIFLKDSSQCKIRNLTIGAELEDNSKVIAIQKFQNTENLYLYKNIFYISGDSKVLENNVSVLIKNSTLSIETTCNPPFVYGITTNTATINIRGTVFVDYNESKNIYINKTINSLILNFWNNKKEKSIEFSKGVFYLENGFAGDTKFNLNCGTQKTIKDLLIGEILENNNKIIGKVELDPYCLLFYEFCGVVVSSNTKVYDDIYWKNIECVSHAEPTQKPQSAFNLITEKGIIKCKNNYFIDYMEKKDDILKNEIEKLLEIGFVTSYENRRVINQNIY